MGKAGKLRKKRRLEQGLAAVGYRGGLMEINESNTTDDMDNGLKRQLVSNDDLGTTLRTLTTLANNPELMQEKAYKPLRALIHKFRNELLIPAGKSLSGKVSDNLQTEEYDLAIRNLALMRQRGEVPRLGALQRWVRDCDAVGFTNTLIVRTLDAILRTADPLQVPTNRQAVLEDGTLILPHEGRICRCPVWEPLKGLVDPCAPYPAIPHEEVMQKFDLIGVEKGPDRLPPNLYDCKIYGSKPGAVALDPSPPSVERIPAPFLPRSCLLRHVLTQNECRQILGLAMGVGLQPDKPLGQHLKEQQQHGSESGSVLADNMIWCADEGLVGALFDRCRPFLPPEIDSRPLAGINRRWRLYRYLPGAEYRPHIDGAWPRSGVDEGGQYVYDIDEKGGKGGSDGKEGSSKCWSRITFLLYLNDGFEGGCTTFFTPAPVEGSLEAYPVRPVAGCVMLFPHGDAEGAVLHEGSGVTEGAKFIVRTDVLYYKEQRQRQGQGSVEVDEGRDKGVR